MTHSVRNVLVTFAVILIAVVASAGERARSVEVNHASTRFRVTIVNMTPGQPFSPALIVVHNDNLDLFEPGEPASEGLALLAEEGDASMMISALMGAENVQQVSVAGDGPFFLGSSVTIEIEAPWQADSLSIMGMLGSTNDSFYGLDSYEIQHRDRQEILIPAYDAGSEHNSEDCDFIPGPPCGSGGMRDTAGAEGVVSISSGIHGFGDLDPSRLGWLNPVAKIIIEPIH